MPIKEFELILNTFGNVYHLNLNPVLQILKLNKLLFMGCLDD